MLSTQILKFTSPCIQQVCNFSLHEHQSHELMRNNGIVVPDGEVAFNDKEALKIAEKFSKDNKTCVIKAQVLAGGRGKGTFKDGFKGGVHLVKSPEQCAEIAKKMIGNTLVTKQSGAEGKPVNKVYIQECVDIERELYFAILLDRESKGPVLIASTQGGMSIEEVAEQTPELILKCPVNINKGLKEEDLKPIIQGLEFKNKDQEKLAIKNILNMYDAFMKNEATLLEINPMVVTKQGKIIMADAKINIDDSAHFRHPELFDFRDFTQEDSREVEAHKHGLSYVGLDGNIGCLVNGAGLAMATMDLIKLYGGEPSNFLDVGGSATQNQIEEAFKIITNDKRVKAILVNIFGGIARCDIIAKGIIGAVKQLGGLPVPLVVRLSGTNSEIGRKLLNESDLGIISAENLNEAAQKASAVVKE